MKQSNKYKFRKANEHLLSLAPHEHLTLPDLSATAFSLQLMKMEQLIPQSTHAKTKPINLKLHLQQQPKVHHAELNSNSMLAERCNTRDTS